MPNEIYHRSEWGNPKPEGWGDIYFDPAATNKLYNHSDNFENSDGTDKILRDIPNKASIVLTPTAYSDGSLNTVIPPYQVLPQELVTNGTFDTDSDWTKDSGWSISGGLATRTNTGSYGALYQNCLTNGKKYKVTITISSITSQGFFGVRLGTNYILQGITEAGTYTATGTSTSTTLSVMGNPTFAGSIDSISIKQIQEADFDFSRGSSATRVNEKGLIEDVQILSGELVQNGDFEQIGSELVINGDFSDGLSGWSSHSGSTLELEDGKAKVTTVSAQGFIKRTDLSIQSGKIYFCTAQITNATSPVLFINGTSNALNPMLLISGNTYGGYITTTGTNSTFYIRGNNTNGQVSYIDNVSVKEVGQNWTFGDGWSMGDGKAIRTGTGSTALSQSFSALQNKKFRLSFKVLDWTVGHLKGYFYGGGGSDEFFDSTSIGNGSFTFEVTTTTNRTNFAFLAFGSFDGSIDNVSIIEITDDTDIPRIDYTSGTGALLLEPQSTNLVTQSETFSTWSTTNASLTSVNLAAPDGSTSVIKMSSSNTSNGEHKVKISNLNVGTNPATSSIFAKMGEVRYIMNRRNVLGTSWQSVVFDLQEGVVAANNYSSDAYPKITHYGNGWYRCEVYYSNVGHTETGWGLSNGTDENFTPTNTTDGLYIWGAQQEDLSYATSYIPTEASTVTRSADVANNSGNADLFNDSEGVLYAEISALANYNTQRWLSISDNTHANTIKLGLLNNATNFRFAADIRVGNTNQALMTYNFGAITPTMTKVAVKYKENDFALWINGVEVATDTSGNTPIGLSSIQFDRGNGGQDFEGNVKSVAVFKEALTDAELESLTSWVSFTEMATDLEYTLE